MRIYIESTTILDLQWKRRHSFLFFKMANTPHKGKTRHIAWSSSFLFKVQCFNRDENDLAPDDKCYIRGKRNALWFWQHFARTRTLAVFDIPIVSTESQVLYSFIIKVRIRYPNFLFSYRLFIALYTNSTYIIWLKYEKRLLLRCIHHFKSDLINNMDHMRISGTEPSSVILSQTK